ncbi:MAG: hypothetical protein AB7E81_24245 [Hyphomicrobiaceae bacterium]
MGIVTSEKRKPRVRTLLMFVGAGLLLGIPLRASPGDPFLTSTFGALVLAAEASSPKNRTERVTFSEGATSATIEGDIVGYETVDYVLRANKGQYMNASMATKNTATYFNILAPGQDTVAFFNGSVMENQFEGPLPKTGDYKVRVYMMRSAARRGERANYRLEVVIDGR